MAPTSPPFENPEFAARQHSAEMVVREKSEANQGMAKEVTAEGEPKPNPTHQ